MKPNELKKWLRKRGCRFDPHKGGSGHLTVIREVNGRTIKTQLPMHGSGKDIRKRLWNKILKDLELK